jgi:hypothetical protein
VKWVFAGVGVVGALFALGVAVLYLWLISPIGWEPPEVASLSAGQGFEADEVVVRDDGYVVAGVAGTSEPDLEDRCSGRFALVELDDAGSTRRAVLASGPERDRFCADRVQAVFPEEAGGWLLSGSAARRGKPSPIFPEPSTDHYWFTLRFSDDGEPDEDFGDGGVTRDALVVGRAEGVLVTYLSQRVTEDGDLRHDLVVDPDRVTPGWSTVVPGRRFFVAIESGPGLTFQTFVVDGTSDPVRFRALHPVPYDSRPRPTVDLGSSVQNDGDLAEHAGLLYAVVEGRPARVFAVDPRRLRLVESFGVRGGVTLPEHTTSAGLAVDSRGRLVVVYSTVHVHGDRVHALRLLPDGSPDPGFGGIVEQRGRDSRYPFVTKVHLDDEGRTLVLFGLESRLLRLTPAGRADPTFGRNGVVSLAGVQVCELPPAELAAACSTR